MEHNYFNLEQSGINTLVLLQKDNNLDGKDNLDSLPDLPAVYAICGRVNGKPANPRYIGETSNLREAVSKHFDRSETGDGGCHECFKEFILSIKIKELVYSLMPDSSQEDRLIAKKEWETKYKPDCNKLMNEIH